MAQPNLWDILSRADLEKRLMTWGKQAQGGDTRTFQQYDKNNATAQRQIGSSPVGLAMPNNPYRAEAERATLANVNNAITGGESMIPMTGMITGKPLNEFMKGSKVIDSAGNPLKLYHGTNKNFDVFNTDANGAHLGSYFTPDVDYANVFSKATSVLPEYSTGAQVIPVNLNLKNPASMDDIAKLIYAGEKDIRGALVRQGFDGVIKKDEIIAFEPDQIRSIYEP